SLPPRIERSRLQLDGDLDIDADVGDLIPGNAERHVALARNRLRDAGNEACSTRAEPSRQGDAAELDRCEARLAARRRRHHDAVDLADLDAIHVEQLLIEKVAEHMHHMPPRIWRGSVTSARTKPRPMMITTAALDIQP